MLQKHAHAERAAFRLLAVCLMLAANASGQSTQPEFDLQQALRGTQAEPDLASERENLEEALRSASEPLEQARARVALANWWVGQAIARPATRWVLDMEDAADRKAIEKAAGQAGEHLEKARGLLDDLGKPEADKDRDEQRELKQAAETLQSFVEIFKRAELGSESEADQEEWRKAGRGLALAREADDKHVAAAALLWQAFAMDRAGKRDRALDALPDAMAKPEHLPHSLMSRLLRCRLMTEAGQAPAAVVLLSRMEAQLKHWVSNENQDRNKARRLIGLVQYQIVTGWIEGNATSQPAAAESLRPLLENVRRGFSEVKSPEVYYMNSAVPMSIAPEHKAPPATQNASPGRQEL